MTERRLNMSPGADASRDHDLEPLARAFFGFGIIDEPGESERVTLRRDDVRNALRAAHNHAAENLGELVLEHRKGQTLILRETIPSGLSVRVRDFDAPELAGRPRMRASDLPAGMSEDVDELYTSEVFTRVGKVVRPTLPPEAKRLAELAMMIAGEALSETPHGSPRHAMVCRLFDELERFGVVQRPSASAQRGAIMEATRVARAEREAKRLFVPSFPEADKGLRDAMNRHALGVVVKAANALEALILEEKAKQRTRNQGRPADCSGLDVLAAWPKPESVFPSLDPEWIDTMAVERWRISPGHQTLRRLVELGALAHDPARQRYTLTHAGFVIREQLDRGLQRDIDRAVNDEVANGLKLVEAGSMRVGQRFRAWCPIELIDGSPGDRGVLDIHRLHATLTELPSMQVAVVVREQLVGYTRVRIEVDSHGQPTATLWATIAAAEAFELLPDEPTDDRKGA